MNAAAYLPHPGAGARPPVGSSAIRRKLWNLLFGAVEGAGRFTAAHDVAHFVIANDVAHRIVREGVTGQALVLLGDLLELGPTQLAPLVGMDRATARRYVQNDQALPAHSTETVLRLAGIEAQAMDVFASEDAAHGWLKKVHPLLGESPVDAASTSYGAQRVSEILVAIKHGGVA